LVMLGGALCREVARGSARTFSVLGNASKKKGNDI
jgi:hypothetical protein